MLDVSDRASSTPGGTAQHSAAATHCIDIAGIASSHVGFCTVLVVSLVHARVCRTA